MTDNIFSSNENDITVNDIKNLPKESDVTVNDIKNFPNENDITVNDIKNFPNDIEISLEELSDLPEGTYKIIDIRDVASFDYSTIPGAVNMPDLADLAAKEVILQKREKESAEETALQEHENSLSEEKALPEYENSLSEEKALPEHGNNLSEEAGHNSTTRDKHSHKLSYILPSDKKLVLLCMNGKESLPLAARLREMGYDSCSLKGGLGAWIISDMDDIDRTQEIDESIRKNKHFHRCLFSKFAKACKEYQLVQPGDKIAVCISGGKDSMLMGKLFQELKRHNKVPFEVIYLVMDPGYNEINRTLIEHNAKMIGLPITIFESRIFDAVDNIDKHPCYMCARMRRGTLYAKAKELGCNKIALGHHYDDVIETILMGMLYGSQIQTMMPKLHSEHFEGMELIRPMYLIREEDVKQWRDFNGLHFIQCACHFTETCTSCRDDGSSISKRMEIKQLIRQLKKTNPYVEGNIFKSVENVNLRTVMAYKQNGVKHYFLDDYDQQN